MGLLEEGLTLSWKDTKYYAAHVKTHGIIQFINQYHKQRHRKTDTLLWGDEVECMLVSRLFRQSYPVAFCDVLHGTHTDLQDLNFTQTAAWRLEYGDYMLESSPARPYNGTMVDLTQPEYNMKIRRKELTTCLETDEFPITLTTFPRLGCLNCTDPMSNPTPDSMKSHSRFITEKVISRTFPKYRLLEQNIRERRGKKIQINIPVFKDIHTADPLQEDLSNYGHTDTEEQVGKKNHIFMDNTGFGTGSCCLQVTVQAGDIQEAKYLYDQLINLSPIMVALSAAAPVHRGYLSDLDTRWPMISQSLDDRTDEELGLKVEYFNCNVVRQEVVNSKGRKLRNLTNGWLEEYSRCLYDAPTFEKVDAKYLNVTLYDLTTRFPDNRSQELRYFTESPTCNSLIQRVIQARYHLLSGGRFEKLNYKSRAFCMSHQGFDWLRKSNTAAPMQRICLEKYKDNPDNIRENPAHVLGELGPRVRKI